MTEVGKDIIRQLIYSDIFRYPLKSSEIYYRLRYNGVCKTKFTKELNKLVTSHHISRIKDYYLLENDNDLVNRRAEANLKASEMMLKAYNNSKLISKFPFVRGVFLSGSISKGYIDDKSDIDFFIVTKPGRLWIARTLLIIYKKIFLLNSYKYFCLNFFIDQDHLEIEDKNLFTATEICSLIPVYNGDEYNKICNANRWVTNYFPHFIQIQSDGILNNKNGKIKLFLETILNNKIGNLLDNIFMKFTIYAVNPRLKQLRKKGVNCNVKFEKHISKYHKNSFRDFILESYKIKINEFENKYNLTLS